MSIRLAQDPTAALPALGTAAAVAAAVLLLCGRPWQRPRPAWLAAGWVLGVAAGFYLACELLAVRCHWPPREDQDRLLLVLLPLVVAVEGAAATLPMPRWLLGALRLSVAASAARILLHGSSYLVDLAGPGSREWPPAQSWVILALLAAALAGVWASLLALAQRRPGRSLPLALALTCAGAAIAVMGSGYASGGLLGLPLAASLAGATTASLLLSGPLREKGAIGLSVIGLFSLLIMGRFFGQLSTTHALVLFAAPLLSWLPELPYLCRLGPRLRGVAALGLVLVPVVIVVMQAQRQFGTDAASISSIPDGLDP